MKRTLLFLAAVAFLASCSTPKYSYNFDHYNYNAGKKKAVASELSANDGLQAIQPEMLTASTRTEISSTSMATPSVEKSTPSKKTYSQLTKTERTEIKNSVKEIKKAIKAEKKGVKATDSTKKIDHDLKLAAIFGAVGIVALIISGQVFYIIGGIALIIGVVFFVKWLIKQKRHNSELNFFRKAFGGLFHFL
jgi:hypothetical protein